MEDTLYDSESVLRFCLGCAAVEGIPDKRSIRRFRHLLEEHRLQEKLMLRVNTFLSDKGILTKTGTIVDVTSGVIHTALCSFANVPDIEMLPALLRGEEREVIGDRGYCS